MPSYFDFPQVVEAAGRVFFWTGTDLWVTDGRRAGTHSVYHLDGASFLSQSRPRLVVAVGGRFLFPAVDPTYGEEIFVTDGTPGWRYIRGFREARHHADVVRSLEDRLSTDRGGARRRLDRRLHGLRAGGALARQGGRDGLPAPGRAAEQELADRANAV